VPCIQIFDNGVIVWLDSSEPARRGATPAVHSTLGYAGGFVGPLMIGFTLDPFGGAETRKATLIGREEGAIKKNTSLTGNPAVRG
jgi:hypothetical protein